MADESPFPSNDESFQQPTLQQVGRIEESGGNLDLVQHSDKLLMFEGSNEFASFESKKVEHNCKRNEVIIEDFEKFKDFGASCEGSSQKHCVKFKSEKENWNLEKRLDDDAVTCSLIEGTTLDASKIGGEVNRRKFVYPKKEMEALRFVNVKAQKKLWKEIRNGLEKTVKKEYDQLGSHKNHKNKNRQMKSGDGQRSLGESFSEDVHRDTEIASSVHFTRSDAPSWRDGNDLAGEWSEQEDSDDEHESIQRPAFMVEGEPNFESGPPEDGLEYLRRVRWEAAHIPKVKVVKIDNSKLKKEQSVYMPKIPDIEKCPPHLVPSKQWEHEFIADFSELRLALSHVDDTNDTSRTDPQTIIFSPNTHSSKTRASLELPTGGPTLSTIAAMEPATRVAMLRKRVTLFENSTKLSKDDCAWLFALCAAVDSPLDADTCASLRCLLRVCAKLRARKSELDDEVVMLNVLATISGKFFGQLEN